MPFDLKNAITWNTIDRLASQLIYAVVGIILANLLSREDYGLLGALTVFQAFAIIFCDSGFGAALLRKKETTQVDYSTVFWFNLIVAIAIYIILWLCAPLIADFFHDRRLIPLSKVMFLTFVANALSIVQVNRLTREMNTRPVAVANSVALIVSGAIGIAMAFTGFGVWALVWQALSMAIVKTAWLWLSVHWVPSLCFSKESLRSIWRIGMSVFSSSILNTLCQNIYSLVIGAYYSLASLGLYTQADKWSKMPTASFSQILTSSFVPHLARYQDNPEQFGHETRRINRWTAMFALPLLVLMAACGTPIFHLLFGTKWDDAIILFQILSLRGVFVIFIGLFSNYLLAKGYGKSLVVAEIVKDGMIFVALLSTVFSRNLDLLVWGQMFASVATFLFMLLQLRRKQLLRLRTFAADILPYLIATLISAAAALTILTLMGSAERLYALLALLTAGSIAAVLYLLLLKITSSVRSEH